MSDASRDKYADKLHAELVTMFLATGVTTERRAAVTLANTCRRTFVSGWDMREAEDTLDRQGIIDIIQQARSMRFDDRDGNEYSAACDAILELLESAK